MPLFVSENEAVEPTIFPDLGYTISVGTEETWSHLDVPVHNFDDVQGRLDRLGVSVSDAVNLAWAMVLRCYTASDALQYPVRYDELLPVLPLGHAQLQREASMEVRLSRHDALLNTARELKTQMDRCEQRAKQQVAKGTESGIVSSRQSQSNIFLQFWRKHHDMESPIRIKRVAASLKAAIVLTVDTSQWRCLPFMTYSTARITPHIAEQISSALASILRHIAYQPEMTIGEVTLTPRTSGSVAVSQTDIEFGNTLTPLCDVIAKVDETREAIRSFEGSISYGQLMKKADALAQVLQQDYSASEGQFIPICIPRSQWAILSMLAIQRAGAAFVPLDPNYPIARMTEIIEQVKSSVLLLTHNVACLRPELAGLAKVVVVDRIVPSLDTSTRANLRQPTPKRPAYCIMTSGSTGKPKGVVLGQRAMAASITTHSRFFGINASTRVLQTTPLTFDPSLTEIYGALLHGACLCIPNDETRLGDLASYINQEDVQWAFFTPSFVSTLDPESCKNLNTVVLGGEAVTASAVAAWAPGRRLVNGYGPTEACCFCCGKDIPVNSNSPANIGKPLGCSAVLVDPENHARLVPDGAPGEMLMRGLILADGYLGDEEKTAAAFIRSPPWATAGTSEVFYKTGDVCRLDAHGDLQYLGRKDNQVKIRGQRVELGEVEHALKRGETRYEVVVDVLRKPVTAEQVLTVFLIDLQPGQSDELVVDVVDQEMAASLADRVKDDLPRYMIPELFLLANSMPVTISGKVDRKRLHALGQERFEQIRLNGTGTPQRSASTGNVMERKLAEVWASHMGMSEETLDLDWNVLSLSDSITAIRVSHKLRQSSIDLTLQDIMKAPTIAGMAATARVIDQDQILPAEVAPFSLVTRPDLKAALIAEAAAQSHIEESNVEDMYPCTPLQESLMALSSVQPGTFVGTYVFRLPAATDLGRVQQAWAEVTAMNPILRTRIVLASQSETYQVVMKESKDFNWGSNEKVQAQLIGGYGGPLQAFSVKTNDDGSHSLTWLVHHCLYDGFSLPQILEDVSKMYNGSKLVSRPHFNTFVRHLRTADFEESRGYWTKHLANFYGTCFPVLMGDRMPKLDRARHTSFNLARSPAANVTQSDLLRAAWAMVVAFHSNDEDVVFGVTVSGRDVPVDGIGEILGPTLATVPMRVFVDKQATINKYLADLRENTLEHSVHAQLGLQALRKVSETAASACKFTTLFVVQPFQSAADDSMILSSKHLEHDEENIDAYPLTIEVSLGEQGSCKVKASLDSTLIESELVERLLQQFSNTAEALGASDPEAHLSELYLASESDVQKLQEWNEAAARDAIQLTVHDQIMSHCISRGDAEALVSRERTFTYAQFDAASDAIASKLQSLGVGPGQYIPLCFEKSSWCVVAMLAVMKTGAAFVPLDRSHPQARLEDIVLQSGSQLVVVSPTTKEMWPDHQVVVVDDTTVWGGEKLETRASDPRGVAYVIFTSGSTGKPKGVMIEHRGISTSCQGMIASFRMNEETRSLQFASYSFDASLLEIFNTLIAGGTVCTALEDERFNTLPDACNRMRLNFAFLTPTYARTLKPSMLPELKVLVCGGEAVDRETIALWHNDVHLVNAYGPTETSITAVTQACTSLGVCGIIGTPSAGPAWIVNPHDHTKLLPIGTPGELLVGGPTLARGYLNDTVKTNAAFVETPSWARTGMFASSEFDRVYKTGDLVRQNLDGTIAYIGRKDYQVKIRGQRLEIGEVETHLTHDSIAKGCVLFPSKGPFAKTLVACVSLKGIPAAADESSQPLQLVTSPQEVVSSVIRAVLSDMSDKMPSYMVPTAVVPVNDIPTNAAMKLDRNAAKQYVENVQGGLLDSIRQLNGSTGDASSIVAPTTDVERLLQAVWAGVLNIPLEKIGITTSFFGLGGDSITAMQVVARARDRRALFTVQDVLRSKVIAKLALSVELEDEDDASASEEQSLEPFPLSPIQRMYFGLAPEEQHFFNQSFFLDLNRPVEMSAVLAALEHLVQRHSMLRARFAKDADGNWTQRISSEVDSSLCFRVHPQVADDKELDALVQQAQASLNTTTGPLLRADLIQNHEDHQRLFLVAHHLVIDLVSWRVMLRELEELLVGHQLTALRSTPFQTWVRKQTERVEKLDTDEDTKKAWPFPDIKPQEASYWGISETENQSGLSEREVFTLDQQLSTQLMEDCNRPLRSDLLDILLAGLVVSFTSVFNDRPAPAVYNEGHGRSTWSGSLDVSETVGWFTTMCPFFLPGLADVDTLEAVRRVNEYRTQVPDSGRDYFALRHCTPAFDSHGAPEICFNYGGRYQQLERDDALFTRLELAGGDMSDISPNMPRFALFDVSAEVTAGQLTVAIVFNRAINRAPLVRDWLEAYKRWLVSAANSLSHQAWHPTRADFPAMRLPGRDMDAILRRLPSPTTASPPQDMFPLSLFQRHVLREQALHPAVFTPRLVYALPRGRGFGFSDVAAAWRRSVDLFPCLRTIFMIDDDEGAAHGPCQVVLAGLEPSISEVRGDGDGDNDPNDVLARPLEPWASGTSPHRLAVFVGADGVASGMLIEISHAIIDFATMNRIMTSFREGLEGPSGGGTVAPVPVAAATDASYADVVEYAASRPKATAEYWEAYLRDHRGSLVGGPAQAAGTIAGLEVEVDATLDLPRFCREHGTTMPTLVRLAWALTLSRALGGAGDVAFGVVVSSRHFPIHGVDSVAGPCINFVPCRWTRKAGADLAEELAAVQADFAASMEHEALSMRTTAAGSASASASARAFDTIVNVRKADAVVGDEKVSEIELVAAQDPFDSTITLEVDELANGKTVAKMTYWPDRMRDGDIERLAGFFSDSLKALHSGAIAC